MEKIYYIAVNGQPVGPFDKDELIAQGLERESLVWKQGMPQWVKASEMGELSDVFVTQPPLPPQPDEEAMWYFISNGEQLGPFTLSQLIASRISPTTPVWRQGMNDWVEAQAHPEVRVHLHSEEPRHHQEPPHQPGAPNFGDNPLYGNSGQQQNYNQNFGRQDYRTRYVSPDDPDYQKINNRQQPTNWMPWAIVATVVGFLFSCIGLIFGIIGIVQANKANSAYAAGDRAAGDSANSNAKTMTIIGFVLAGVGLIVNLFILGSMPWNLLY